MGSAGSPTTSRATGLEVVLTRGPDHLLWAICDDLVDGYFPLMDKLGDEIDLLQDAVIEKGDPRRSSGCSSSSAS